MIGTGVQLRVAAQDDIEFLARIVLLSIQDRYGVHPDWDPEAFYRGLVDDAADQVAGGPENSTTYVIMNDGIDVGRLRLITTPQQVEIAGLQVHPDHQNRGIGTAVITNILEQPGTDGISVVLDVELDNPNARRLYERLGFTPSGSLSGDRLQMIFPPDRPRSSPTPG